MYVFEPFSLYISIEAIQKLKIIIFLRKINFLMNYFLSLIYFQIFNKRGTVLLFKYIKDQKINFSLKTNNFSFFIALMQMQSSPSSIENLKICWKIAYYTKKKKDYFLENPRKYDENVQQIFWDYLTIKISCL